MKKRMDIAEEKLIDNNKSLEQNMKMLARFDEILLEKA